MKWFVLAMVIVSGFGVARAENPEIEAELSGLQGTWVAESEELNGVPTPTDKLDRTLTVDGNKFTNTFRRGSGVHTSEGKLVLDPSQSPKAMDLVGAEFERQAIYKIEDGKLLVCVQHDPAKARPAGFKTTKDSGYGVAIYVRKK
jgi:uncharacterized protein (TIGR03067 family)